LWCNPLCYKDAVSLCIRALTAVDLDACEALATRAYGRRDTWRSDIQLYLDLEPAGCYVAVLDGRVVGLGGGINYGPFAWIGLMGVHPDLQGQGIGRSILDRILSWAQAQQCPVTVLDASDSGAPLYSHAGFVDQGKTTLFGHESNGMGAHAAQCRVSVLGDADLTDVLAFDCHIFGADRSRVLSGLLAQNRNRAFLVHDNSGAVAGYVIAQPGRIGPWLAGSSEHAEVLLVAALTLTFAVPPMVYVPSQNLEATELLSCYGFAPRRALRHMHRGPVPGAHDRAHIYGQGSFSLG